MSLTVDFHPQATSELEQIFSDYESCRGGLGQEFFADVRHRLFQAVDNPRRFPPYRSLYRRIAFKRWPYLAVYAFTSSRLVVVAVFHVARDPAWIDRQLRDRT